MLTAHVNPHFEKLEAASFSNIVNLKIDFNLRRSVNPILEELLGES